MLTLLQVSPLLAVVILLATRRVDVLTASLVSVSLALAAAWATVATWPGQPGVAAADIPFFLLGQIVRGSWLAWQAIVLMLGGFFFFECLRLGGASFRGALEPSYRRVFMTCVVLGPFFEACTGFGVGLLLTLGFLRAMGLGGAPAVMLGLYSQTMGAWGALGLGMVIGAQIAGIPVGALGYSSAVLLLPLLLANLFVFWRIARAAGLTPRRQDRWEDVAWVVGAGAAFIVANSVLPFELAHIVPYGTVALLLLHRVGALRIWRGSLGTTAPYLAVITLLILTRLIPGAPEQLRIWRLRPFPEGLSYEPFYNPSFWLVVVGLVVFLGGAGGPHPRRLVRLGLVFRAMATSLWRPGLVTVLFLVVAQLLAASGIARTLAEQAYAVAGPFAVATSPVFPALIGFLSASNTASNSMLMPVQAALAGHAGVSLPWLAALQNISGAQLCPLSPVRVTMGCALIGDGAPEARVSENAVYAQGWPLLVLSSIILLGEALLVLAG